MYFFVRKLVEIYVKLRYKLVVHGKENYAFLPKGGYIIACNHQSYSDPPVVGAVFRGKFSFMAKSELFKNPIFGWLIRCCGAFPVNRGTGDTSALENAAAQVKKGRILVIFPEGTRSKNGEIGRARSGIAVIAAKVNAPIVPVCIVYAKGGDESRADVAIGKPITLNHIELDIENRKTLRSICEKITNEIKELKRTIEG